jgi:branched-chain amino acid aminotransferase
LPRHQGNLSEGSGQNIFLVRENVIYTPPIGNSVLSGVTRDSVVTIARDLGFEVREQTLPREMLYISDEVFFVGRPWRSPPSSRWTASRSAEAGAGQ